MKTSWEQNLIKTKYVYEDCGQHFAVYATFHYSLETNVITLNFENLNKDPDFYFNNISE